MQQAGQARIADFVIGQPQLAAQRHHQRAYRYGMQERVAVFRFQAHQACQRARVAVDGARNGFHQRQCVARFDRAAHARVGKHGLHGHLGFADEASGVAHFFRIRDRAGRDIGVSRAGRRCRNFRRSRRCIGGGHVGAARGVDPHLAHAAGTQALQLGGVFHAKTGPPERVVQPRADKFVEVHAHPQVFDGDALAHVDVQRSVRGEARFLRNGFKERLPANGCILFYRTCGRGLEGEKSGLAM